MNIEPEEPTVVTTRLHGGPAAGEVLNLSCRFVAIHVSKPERQSLITQKYRYVKHRLRCNGFNYIGWFYDGLSTEEIERLALAALCAPSSPAAAA